ncbi:MAG TPA: long-chain fatty acid--CoA ligase [Acidimicrobiales bacterium]|nr:long-chain fatty acid--CoA ligase [Acidimicrobiales bacterium]
MTLLMLLEMIASAFADRVAIGTAAGGITYGELLARAGAGAEVIRGHGAEHLAYVGESDVAFPVAVFAAAWAGVPLLPLNYRLADDQLQELLGQHDDVLVLTEEPTRVPGMPIAHWNAATAAGADPGPSTADGEDVAVLLYTSGTTSAPKAVVLRHRHLTSYVISSVEFAGADEGDATLTSVPPYHIAGVANVVSNVYAGRRVVYLPTFTPETWLETVRAEGISHAMVVPTMLARVVEHLGDAPAGCDGLRSLAYGGARMPVTVLERALAAFPGTDFVNAYGLTETSSTIAVLGPEDHRKAMEGDDAARSRLGSCGRLVPGIEVEVRDGEVWVRGEQVSGEYLGQGGALDPDGWFPTRDRGWVDDEGYLFIEGRSDDTIIRGGENIAPAEIEDALLAHPAVAQAAVVGLPDEEWGQRLAAAVVLRAGEEVDAEALRAFARERLRSSKTPDVIAFRDDLPMTDTGKLLRRVVLADLLGEPS